MVPGLSRPHDEKPRFHAVDIEVISDTPLIMSEVVILIKSRDQKGLVSKVSSYVFERGFNIIDCQQHAEMESGNFFMRLKLDLDSSSFAPQDLESGFDDLAQTLGLTWSIHYSSKIERVAILVSKASHCLYDLLVRQKERELRCKIPLIIGNHDKLKAVANQFGIDFFHLPVIPDTKEQQEASINALLKEHDIGLVVLARYMQILSPSFVEKNYGRAINIHHAFLPAFKGARPFQRAYERGVKMIGATAHYVTSDLDEGPIIEQDVRQVTHEDSPKDLQRISRDIERVVLARAVKAHLEHRVIITGRRTIVFSSGV